MKPKNLIVFDMDGVIIDVSNSYRDVVRQTTRLFFSPARASANLPDPLFELSDLAAVKHSGGLNNDWDLTFVVIGLLFSLINTPKVHESGDPWTRYRESLGHLNVDTLAGYLKSTDNPLKYLLSRHGKRENEFIASLYKGDVGSGNIIKQIFQEIYLGTELFKSTYRMEPEAYRGQGYILREKLLLDRSTLEQLSRKYDLAIATGRPRAEAEYPLAHFKIKQFFPLILSLDDCIREEKRIFEKEGKTVSLSKPDPYMLDTIAENCRNAANDFFYIGDMPDDMVAAARSRFDFKSVGILISAPDKSALRQELLKAGADYLVDDFASLKAIFL
jgi:phosphoglycolate phosphatase-like HAD superfamily hydrolase